MPLIQQWKKIYHNNQKCDQRKKFFVSTRLLLASEGPENKPILNHSPIEYEKYELIKIFGR